MTMQTNDEISADTPRRQQTVPHQQPCLYCKGLFLALVRDMNYGSAAHAYGTQGYCKRKQQRVAFAHPILATTD